MARTKSNPESTGLLLLLGAAAVGIYGYMQGWFSSAVMVPVTTPTPNQTGTNNPVTNPATQIINAPVAPPPLGTVVTDANQIAAQAAAGLAYILPDQSIGNIQSLTPNGYSAFASADHGIIFLRNNVYGPVYTVLQDRINRAISQGAPQTSVANAGNMTLDQIQTVMSTNGLAGFGAGLGWYRG